MLKKVRQYIAENNLLKPDDNILVGLSGGTDSVALLHILLSLGYKCIAAHCNFRLRGAESDRDEEFVKDLCLSWNVPCYIIHFETKDYATKIKSSIEMAARELRYNWFNTLLHEQNADVIAVAHQSDDNLETLLMNLVRGTGIRGLKGIDPRHERVIRPLLCLSRKETETYLILHSLKHVEDSSNSTTDYVRNKYRHEVLPLLESINSSARKNMLSSLKFLNGNFVIYQNAIENLGKQILNRSGEVIKLNIDLLKGTPHPPTVLYELLQPFGFQGSVCSQIIQNLDAECGSVFYSLTHRLIKDRENLIVHPINPTSGDIFMITAEDRQISKPIGMQFRHFKRTDDFTISKSTDCAHIDESLLHYPLEIRKWRNGDRFYPLGMNHSKKLSDYFANRKLSIYDKESVWLLVSNGEIVWIIGERLDHRYRITAKSEIIAEFRLIK